MSSPESLLHRESVNSPERPILSGLKVLDLSQAIAGPMAAMFCGDFGAEVIKVEPPSGDMAKGLPPHADGMSTYFGSANRNKKSICLDTTTKEGQEILKKLIAEADVVVLNTPNIDSMKKREVDIDSLAKINPDIIAIGISYLGHTGPKSGYKGYDYTMQAFLGAMAGTGDPETNESWRHPGPYIDYLTALNAFNAILLALMRRDRNGHEGKVMAQFLDVSLLNSAALCLFNTLAEAATFGVKPKKLGNIYEFIHPYRAFQTKDGESIVIAAASQNNWMDFCNTIGRPDLLTNPLFMKNNDRVKHRKALDKILEPTIAEKSADEWQRIFDEAKVPVQKVQDVTEFLADVQTKARGVMIELVDKNGRKIIVPANPLTCSGLPQVIPTFPPEIGEQTEEILASINCDPTFIQQLEREGIIVQF